MAEGSKQSAGLLIFRRTATGAEVLLVHPGGPFWANKDSWSIPKGELDENEDRLTAAKREFKEETSLEPPAGDLIELGLAKQSAKTNYIWAVEGNVDLSLFHCGSLFEIEWPPKSGLTQQFPEIDRADWFNLAEARQKLFKAQTVFIDRLAAQLGLELPQQAALF